MSFTGLLLTCLAVYLTVVVAELVITRQLKHFFFELVVIIAVGLLAMLVTLTSHTPIAFGEMSSLLVLGVMVGSSVCGIVARYIFYLEGGRFSWLDVLKPLSITPMVLMP